MTLCGACFSDPNPHVRKAGVAIMGVITEGESSGSNDMLCIQTAPDFV
jgi:hypothetical protein